jgi:cyclic pyranopterin monophosphate synthase
MTAMARKLSHLDDQGRARMVDVGDKPVVSRRAVAEGFIVVAPATVGAISSGNVPKGDVLAVARIAGIMAAKNCGQTIPLCHPLPLESVEVQLTPMKDRIHIRATTRITAKTGVEMEALCAVTTAALTVYDMCKAIDKSMHIEGVKLVEKVKG